MLRKNIFFAFVAAILDMGNRDYFLNIPVITQIEFMNTEMFFLVQQIHIRSCLKLPIARKLIVIRRPSWIFAIFQWNHTIFLNRRSFCNVDTWDKIKCNNCVFVFLLKSKMSDLVIYWPPFWIFSRNFEFLSQQNCHKSTLIYWSHIFQWKNYLIMLNRTRYMNIYSFLAAIFDFSRHFENKAKSGVAGKLIS